MRLSSIPGWIFVVCVVGPIIFLIAQAIRPKEDSNV